MKYNFYLEKIPETKAIYLREANSSWKKKLEDDFYIGFYINNYVQPLNCSPRLDCSLRGEALEKAYAQLKVDLEKFDAEAELRKYIKETTDRLVIEFRQLRTDLTDLPKTLAEQIAELTFYSEEEEMDIISVKAVSKIIKDYLDIRFKAEQ